MISIPKLIDLTGKRYGKLLVIDRSDLNIGGKPAWNCVCDCGSLKSVRGYLLSSGQTQSCGCYKIQQISKSNSTHKMSRTPFYNIWKSLRQRCNNEKSQFYEYYGGRGIKVCDNWNSSDSFMNFYNDMYEDYLNHIRNNNGDTEIDRVDCNGNYSRENCKWVTRSENMKNTRRSDKYGKA